MADVQARPAGVGEHVQDVLLGHIARLERLVGGKGVVLQPILLPFLFKRGEVVSHSGIDDSDNETVGKGRKCRGRWSEAPACATVILRYSEGSARTTMPR